MMKTLGEALGYRAKAVLLGLETMARERGSSLRIEVASDAPSMVWGDPHRLGQILSNLLTNALKYSEGGQVALRVLRGGNGLVYSVEDTGPGIGEEFQKVMFGAYQQEQEEHFGWGLGLGICRSLAQLLGGRLEYHNGPLGSRFSLWLPLVEAKPPVFASPRGKAKPMKGEFHALVVEDQPLVAQALVGQLGKLGVSARVAHSPEQALLELTARVPELIFLDLHLGGGDGFTVCREIRRRHGSAPLVVGLTGDTAKGTRRRCLESGMNDCVFKPLSYARLSELLRLVGRGGQGQGVTVDEKRAQLNR